MIPVALNGLGRFGQHLLTRADGVRHGIDFFAGPGAPWLGRPLLWLECSGRHTVATEARRFCRGDTRQVLVSATSPGADQTVVMGFNESTYSVKSRVVSYGSCTVNAFVPCPSLIDFRFRLASRPALTRVREALYGRSCQLGARFHFPVADSGILDVLGRPYNAVIPRAGIKLVGDNLALRGYFDNENSAVRYL